MKGIAVTTIAACFALAAFAVAVAAGLASGNPAASVLSRAIISLVVCYPVGLATGIIAQQVIQQRIKVHQDANPAPDSSDGSTQKAPKERKADDEEVIVV